MVFTLHYSTADAPTALIKRKFLSKAAAMQFAAQVCRERGKPFGLRSERGDVVASADELQALGRMR